MKKEKLLSEGRKHIEVKDREVEKKSLMDMGWGERRAERSEIRSFSSI